VLKRIEEDAPLLSMRITPEAQAIGLRQFEQALSKQKAMILDLEGHIPRPPEKGSCIT
jgi:hypothetical protein